MGAKPEFLRAAKFLRCEGCDAHRPKAQTSKVALQRTYEFNRTVGVDIFEVKDVDNTRYSILSMVDQGTCFQQACVVREGGSQPSSQTCFEAFQEEWSSWAGQPHEVITDRGLHNRGAFARGLASRGTTVTTIGVESPEMIGRTERHGGLLKAMIVRTIAELKLSGSESIAEAVNQCVITKNSMSRVKGFAPAQWVLGRLPREPGTVFEEDSWADLGSLQMASDGANEFGRIARIREKARKAFVRADMSPRVLLEILRASGAKPEFLRAAKFLRCEGCDAHRPKAQTSKVALPRTYEFNRTVGVDIFEVKDVDNTRYSILSMVDQGTCFQQACVVREGGSQPSSQTCFKAFQEKWSSWAGQPHEVVTDRGLHNRGAFAQGLASRGTTVTTIGVESPEMIVLR